MEKSYFLTITQYENLGDLFINKMLLEEISKYSEVFLDEGFSSNPFIDELKSEKFISVPNTYGLSLHSHSKLIKTLLFIKKNGIRNFFVSPGPKSIRSIFKPNILALIFIYFWCKFNGINVYFIGVDLRDNSFSNKVFNKLLSLSLKKIFVRDKVMFKKLDLKNSEYIPDLCFLSEHKVENKKDKKVLMSFRKIEDADFNQNFERYLDTVIKYYTERNYMIEFFYQVGRDKDYNKYLYSKFSDYKNISLNEKLIWYDDIDKLYSNSSIVISNRMHVLLLGLIKQNNIIALVGNHPSTIKINYVFESIGIKDAIYDMEDGIYKGLKLELTSDSIFDITHEQNLLIKNKIKNIFIN